MEMVATRDPLLFFSMSYYLCSMFGQEFWSGGGQEPRDGCSLSPPLMLVAFVKIWSDERLLCSGGNGRKEERGEEPRDGGGERWTARWRLGRKKATSRNYSALTKATLSLFLSPFTSPDRPTGRQAGRQTVGLFR